MRPFSAELHQMQKTYEAVRVELIGSSVYDRAMWTTLIVCTFDRPFSVSPNLQIQLNVSIHMLQFTRRLKTSNPSQCNPKQTKCGNFMIVVTLDGAKRNNSDGQRPRSNQFDFQCVYGRTLLVSKMNFYIIYLTKQPMI